MLIENTPAVTLEAGGITASVTVRFTLSPEAASATCALQELRQGAECETFDSISIYRPMATHYTQ